MIPEFELWIKASVIDKVSKGACPLCQQWYMVAYILAENKLASFKVITVPENSPPKILREKSSSGLFPVVIGIAGQAQSGDTVEGMVADESCELEQFFQKFRCPLLKMDAADQIIALNIFLDLNRLFNTFLTTGHSKKLSDIMRNLNDHLKENGTKFIIGDQLTYADCVLLPRLHHVKLAGKKLKGYDIPHDLVYLWRYIENAYKAEAFINTCPTDPVIIGHYQKKAQVHGIEATLMKETTTLTIPNDIVLDFKPEEPEQEEEEEEEQGNDEIDNMNDGVEVEVQEVVNNVEELSEKTSNISVENGNGVNDFNSDTGEVDAINVNTTEVIVHEVSDLVDLSTDLDNSPHSNNGETPAE